MLKRKKPASDPKKLWEAYLKASLKRDWEKAMVALQSIIKLEPDNSKIHLRMGDLLQKVGANNEAIRSYHRSASLLVKNGFGQKALALYKIILRLDPRDKEALSVSESLLATTGGPSLPTFSLDEELPIKRTEQEAPSSVPAARDDDRVPEELPPVEDIRASETPDTASGMPPVAGLPDTGIASGRAVEDEAVEWSGPLPEIFRSLEKDELAQIIKDSVALKYDNGETVVTEGEPGDSIYVIMTGSVMVTATFGDKSVELASLGGGDVFGEVAFLTGKPRTATVVAGDKTEVLEIDRDVLERATGKYPHILSCLAEYYHNRVRDTVTKVKRAKKPKSRFTIRE